MPGSPTPKVGADEAAIHCRDLASMTAFYRDIVGLEVVEDDYPDTTVLLRAGEGFASPPSHVALFVAEDEDEPLPAPHHLTLTVPGPEALVRAEAWFRAKGLVPETAGHAWIGWQFLRIRDPEGNTVELAAPVRQHTVSAVRAGRE